MCVSFKIWTRIPSFFNKHLLFNLKLLIPSSTLRNELKDVSVSLLILMNEGNSHSAMLVTSNGLFSLSLFTNLMGRIK